MSPAVVSLLALVVAIVLSMTSRINVGLLAIAMAWLIGVYATGLRADVVMGGFPVALFLTLTGVTLLFGIADTNGTLEGLAHRAVGLARGNVRLLPLLFFLIAFAISTVGPGAISSVALVVPLAMVIGERTGVPPFLTALMVANGANAGNLSPIASVGVIANSAMAKAGLGGHEWRVWIANFAAHALVALAAYALLGPHRQAATAAPAPVNPSTVGSAHDITAMTQAQRLTLAVIVAWIVGVVGFKLNLGLSAFGATAVLLLARVADEVTAIRKVPWSVILMVSGVSLLVALLEQTGGMDLFTTLLARLATPDTLNGVIAFVTGAISTYSSTSGVVLPAFLPTAVTLVEKVGGGDPLAVALSINVGSALVDVSPLSTLGALCVAAVSGPVASRRLFNQLMAWGVSMTVVGALLCQLLAGLLARA
ncbi:MAG: C4-dicarboxylate ABC transporter [Gemmatimonadetes bacterium]|nr:C4-dicarboxylate ABC transporter [Gemmatimonadota bacterium]